MPAVDHGDPEGYPEYAWLIEISGYAGKEYTQYFSVKGCLIKYTKPHINLSWTTDSLLALRFAREEDAQDFFEAFIQAELPQCKIAEHCWDV